jgi:hypothetical protein
VPCVENVVSALHPIGGNILNITPRKHPNENVPMAGGYNTLKSRKLYSYALTSDIWHQTGMQSPKTP